MSLNLYNLFFFIIFQIFIFLVLGIVFNLNKVLKYLVSIISAPFVYKKNIVLNNFFFIFFIFDNIFKNLEFNSKLYIVSFNHYVFLSFSLQIFLFGLVGVAFNKRNFVTLLLSIEIMFLGLGLLFIGFSSLKYTLVNFSLPLLILGVSACETAIGLSILIFMYKFGWQTDNFLFKNFQINKNELRIVNRKDQNLSEYNTYNYTTRKNYGVLFIALIALKTNNEIFFSSSIVALPIKNLDYVNIFFFWLTSFFFMLILFFISRILALHKPDRQKLSSYECGFEPFSDSRGKQDILFYVVGILFILFDIELVFIVPWSACHSFIPISSYFLIFFFIFTLILGFIYEWRNGALNWVKN